MMSSLTIETPLGAMLLAASDTGLTGAWFAGQRYFPPAAGAWPVASGHRWLDRARAQVDAYFAGQLRTFDVPLDLQGTPFQQRVWRALCEIPYATTTTYGDLARLVAGVTSTRAVGAAVGRNPISIIVPCHRVIGRDGSLTGYAGGLDRKTALLGLEAAAGPISSVIAPGESGAALRHPLPFQLGRATS